jgi:hypothetical protein
MTDLRAAEIRFRVDPADVPADKAARRLHLTLEQFNQVLPNLIKRGFPAADPDTGMFDLDAIDAWRRNGRHRLSKNVENWAAQLAADSDPARDDQPRDLIYVIGFAGYVKIGFTKWPLEYRLASIQTSCPEKLHIYATFRGSLTIEAELHRRFAGYGTHGERFRREGALAEWIDGGCK